MSDDTQEKNDPSLKIFHNGLKWGVTSLVVGGVLLINHKPESREIDKLLFLSTMIPTAVATIGYAFAYSWNAFKNRSSSPASAYEMNAPSVTFDPPPEPKTEAPAQVETQPEPEAEPEVKIEEEPYISPRLNRIMGEYTQKKLAWITSRSEVVRSCTRANLQEYRASRNALLEYRLANKIGVEDVILNP